MLQCNFRYLPIYTGVSVFCSVPRSVCFGAGSQRAFPKPAYGSGGKKQKHFQKNKKSTKVDLEHMQLDDLASALEKS